MRFELLVADLFGPEDASYKCEAELQKWFIFRDF
jgi:hypothetical protein